MKSFFKLLEKTAGPIGLLTATAGAILDFLTPLGNYIYVLAAILLVLTVLSAICSKSNPMLQKVKNSTAFAPDFIKNELVELWQPDGVAFWKKGLFQVLTFLTALSMGAAVYAKDNPKGFLATKIDSVASLQTSLRLIDSKLGDISAKQDKIIEGVDTTNKKLDSVKKETSQDPRKELANMGVDWNEENFWEAIINNDKKVSQLFVDGNFHITSDDYYEANILNYIYKNGDSQLLSELLTKGIIDKKLVNSKYSSFSVKQYNDLITERLDKVNQKNTQIHASLLKTTQLNELVNIGLPPHFGEMDVSPLLCAIWGKNQKLVNVLVEFGANSEPITVVSDSVYSKRSEFVKSYSISLVEEANKNGINLDYKN